MAVLVSLEDMIKIDISTSYSIIDLMNWLDEQGLVLCKDYGYGGGHNGRYLFMFANPNAASLFKLTWGGL